MRAPAALAASPRLVTGALALVVAMVGTGCPNPSFNDCVVSCNAESGCPNGLTCESEGYCRVAGFSDS